MMNQEIKAKWVAALRSGQYEQAKEVLHSEASGGFCCLGVLCVLSMAETGFGISDTLEETAGDNFLGLTVMQWAGLPFEHGDKVVIDGQDRLLSSHNDDGKTFAQIADAIEAQL